MPTKTCVACGEAPKMQGHPKWCAECWLPRQPMTVQVDKARARLALVAEPLRVARVPAAQWPEGRRWCAGCQTFVRLSYVSGSRCKACASAAGHAGRLKSTYTLGGKPFTDVEYEALRQLQGDRCYLCHRANAARRLAVDHDHATGEVRGLLCADNDWGCNLKVVARFDADPDPVAMARRLLAYLTGDTPARRVLTGR